MCGIAGMFGVETQKTFSAFRDLWCFNVIRGEDSAGVAAINLQNHVKIAKAVGVPHDAMYTKQYEKIMKKNNLCYIAHTRYRTIGDISQETAHPFSLGNITGVHNGTVRNRYKLINYKEFNSDSANIFHYIDEKGIDETWLNLDGAAALVWWDKKEKTLNMLRNSERPLFFAFIGKEDQEGSCLFFASEKWMLEIATARRGLSLGTVFYPKPNMLFSFSYDKKNLMVNYKTKELEPYKFVSFISKAYNGNKVTSFKNKQDSFTFKDLMKKSISRKEFNKNYQECVYCGDNLWDEYEDAVILDQNSAICGDCATTANNCGISNMLH